MSHYELSIQKTLLPLFFQSVYTVLFLQLCAVLQMCALDSVLISVYINLFPNLCTAFPDEHLFVCEICLFVKICVHKPLFANFFVQNLSNKCANLCLQRSVCAKPFQMKTRGRWLVCQSAFLLYHLIVPASSVRAFPVFDSFDADIDKDVEKLIIIILFVKPTPIP